MDENVVICPQCGTENKDTTKFCRSCGNKLVEDAQVAEVPAYEPEAEQPVYAAEPVYAEPAPAPKPKKECTFFKNHPLKSLIRVSVTLLLAIVMLFSCFTSVVKYTTDISGKEYKYFKKEVLNTDADTYALKFSPVDLVVMALDSFQSKDDEDIADDWDDKLEALYDEMEEAEDDDKDMRKLYAKYQKYEYRMNLQSEYTIPNFYLIIAGGFSIAYIVLAIIFIIKAILDFIFFFTKKEYEPKSSLLSLLCKIGSMSLVVFFMAKMAVMSIGVTVADPEVNALKMGGAGTVLTFVIIAVIGLVVYRFIFEKVDIKRLIFNTVSTVSAALIMCAFFMPLISSTVKTTFDGKSKATEASTTLDMEDILVTFEEDFDGDYTDTVSEIKEELYAMDEKATAKNILKYHEASKVGNKDNDYNGSLGKYSEKDFEKGEADGEVLGMYKVGMIATFGSSAFTLFATILYMFAMFTASIMFSQGLANIATGKRSMGKTITAKIFTSILFALATLMVVILPMTYAYTAVSFSLGIGTVVALIALIVVIACPAGDEKVRAAIEE